MNRLSKCLFIAAASVAMTGVAFAQDPPPDDAGGGGDAQPAGGEAGGEAGATVGTDGTAMTPPDAGASMMYTADTWPKAYVKRPQVIYKGGIEVSPRLDIDYESFDDGMGNSDSSTVTSLGVGGRYGVADNIEILASFDRIVLTGVEGIETGDRVKGSFTAGAGIGVARGQLDAEVKAALNYDLLLETAAILAGVDVRFNINDKMWVGTPVNRPGLVAFVKGLEFDFGGMSTTISPIFFNLPVAFAFQATPELAIQANTGLFTLNLNEDAKGGPDGDTIVVLGSDGFGIPFDVDFIYALSNKMDVQANLNLGDLKNAGDNIGISAGVNIRM